MKKIFLFIAILAVLTTTFFYSCKKESGSEGPGEYKANIVPIQLARKIAERIPPNYFTSNLSSQRVDDFPALDRAISTEYTVKDENDIDALYVFNYQGDSGYVVMSAELWHQPICAYIDKGSVEEYDSVPGPLMEWFGKTVENIQFLRDASYTDTATGKAAWWLLLEETNLTAYNETLKLAPIDPPPGDCNEGWNTVTVGPLLTTTWGQACTYNDLCPNQSCGFCANSRTYTGCVATAMAQVIRYWQPTTSYSYNYASMPNAQGNGEVQRLMADAGDNVDMHYGCDRSWADGADVPWPLQYIYGFTWPVRSNYVAGSYLTVKSDLANHWPVLLEGCASRRRVWFFFWQYSNCHEWVCDGYNQISNHCYGYLYFHMNWGWHEQGTVNDHNGWFLFNNWNVNGSNFQYAQDYVHNIHL